MNSQLDTVNSKLNGFSKRFVVGLTIVHGEVERLGRLEQSRSWHTDSRSVGGGKLFNSGFFLGGSRGSSDTQETILHSINLVKIGPTTATDVIIGSSAIYDALEERARVACIFSYDKRLLYVVQNKSNGIQIGMQPHWGHLSMYKWISWIVGGFFLYSAVTSFSIISLAIGLAGLALGRVFQLALKRSQEIWGMALNQINQV